MQQTKLGFASITAEAAQHQRVALAEQWEREHPPQAATAAAAAPLKRGPGRPRKRVLPAADAEDVPAAQKPRTGSYTNWFGSPYIHDILQALRKHNYGWKAAVATLKRTAPDDRYVRLSDSTVRAWFDKEHQLLPKYQAQVAACKTEARGGRPPLMTLAVQDECKRVLLYLREKGLPVNTHVIRYAMQSVFKRLQPALLQSMRLSHQYLSHWVHTQLKWRWRARTTAASKLPLTWEDDGVQMAKRLAANMEMYSVHPSLVINLDQTGVSLVPAAHYTYERQGNAAVATVGAEDKRQITAVLASSLSGDLLPLQLVFTGKTQRCLPAATADSIAARVHLTFSDNHWSSQQTMQQWITHVLMLHVERCIEKHQLNSDAKIILVLDVWSVHKSEQFRLFLRTHHPRIHLVFVPANCTSKLQVADVALQRPFKAAIRNSFHVWAAAKLDAQLNHDSDVGEFLECFKMVNIKPLVLQWCVDSWTVLAERKQLILSGWGQCCTSLYDVHNREKRVAALAEVAQRKLDDKHVPDEDEPAASESASDQESSDDEAEMDIRSTDDDKDELDVAAPIPEPARRRSTRERKQIQSQSYMLNSQQLAMTEDSEC
jgi:predicted  nucleic acid-binding Zn-ribbon protein